MSPTTSPETLHARLQKVNDEIKDNCLILYHHSMRYTVANEALYVAVYGREQASPISYRILTLSRFQHMLHAAANQAGKMMTDVENELERLEVERCVILQSLISQGHKGAE